MVGPHKGLGRLGDGDGRERVVLLQRKPAAVEFGVRGVAEHQPLLYRHHVVVAHANVPWRGMVRMRRRGHSLRKPSALACTLRPGLGRRPA